MLLSVVQYCSFFLNYIHSLQQWDHFHKMTLTDRYQVQTYNVFTVQMYLQCIVRTTPIINTATRYNQQQVLRRNSFICKYQINFKRFYSYLFILLSFFFNRSSNILSSSIMLLKNINDNEVLTPFSLRERICMDENLLSYPEKYNSFFLNAFR